MDPELQKLIEAGKLTTKSAAQLEKLKPGTFCLHKSWGFGRVREWNLLLNQIIIDFAGKKSHPMQAQYAAENLTPLAPELLGPRLSLTTPFRSTAPRLVRLCAGNGWSLKTWQPTSGLSQASLLILALVPLPSRRQCNDKPRLNHTTRSTRYCRYRRRRSTLIDLDRCIAYDPRCDCLNLRHCLVWLHDYVLDRQQRMEA